jgi:hypothetical protein
MSCVLLRSLSARHLILTHRFHYKLILTIVKIAML